MIFQNLLFLKTLKKINSFWSDKKEFSSLGSFASSLKKYTHKYIHNKIPKFNGSENVLDYIDDAKHFADQHPSLLGKELVNNLKIGITGEARTVLRGYDINDSQKLFKVLRSIFEPKVDGIKTALIMKQSTSESVRVFSAKVRDYLSRSGVKDRALDQINLQALLQGLRPEIAKQIPITERRKLSKTLRVATEIETEIKFKREAKMKDKESICAMKASKDNALETKLSVLLKTEADMMKRIKELEENNVKLLAMTSNSLSNGGASWKRERNRYQAYSRPNTNHENANSRTQHDRPRYSSIICYICKEKGHGYMKCLKATTSQKVDMLDSLRNTVF